jgi:hypothetical protein
VTNGVPDGDPLDAKSGKLDVYYGPPIPRGVASANIVEVIDFIKKDSLEEDKAFILEGGRPFRGTAPRVSLNPPGRPYLTAPSTLDKNARKGGKTSSRPCFG